MPMQSAAKAEAGSRQRNWGVVLLPEHLVGVKLIGNFCWYLPTQTLRVRIRLSEMDGDSAYLPQVHASAHMECSH